MSSMEGSAGALPEQAVAALATDPDLYLAAISYRDNAALLRQMNEEAYRQSPFLDEQRIVASSGARWTLPLDRALALPFGHRPCRHIFHMGHVGSTLISRLLGASPDALALREPQALNIVAQQSKLPAAHRAPAFDRERDLQAVIDCLARVYRPSQTAVLKATTVANNLIEPILRTRTHDRVLLIFARPSRYVASMAAFRNELVRFHRQSLHWDVPTVLGEEMARRSIRSVGELAGLTWALFARQFSAARALAPSRTHLLDFDDFVVAPEETLRRLTGFFELEQADPDALATLLSRHAKGGAVPFDADARRAQVAERERRHADEIVQAQRFLEDIGFADGRFPASAY